MDSIKINKETAVSDITSTNNQKFFVDRDSQSRVFNKKLNGVFNGGHDLIYYAGTGGIGKSALIKKLEHDLSSKSTTLIFKSVSYDFTSGTDMLTVLNALKKLLSNKYPVEFPFFEKGCFSYYKRCGDEAGKNQIEKIWNESTVFSKFRKKLDTVGQQLYNASNAGRVMGESIAALGYIADGIPMFRLAKFAVDFLDKRITEIQKIRLENESDYRSIVAELEERETNTSPEVIKEYLPTLFAMDISHWLAQNNLFLVVFLDTYEQLTEDEKDTKRHEKLIYKPRDVPADWWIENLIINSMRVLWVIAGRSKIEKIGTNIKISTRENLSQLNALVNDFADEFLIKAGIEDDKLREGIVKLTKGYPLYLAVCADTYNELRANSRVPTLEDFGNQRKSIIKRLLNYMNDSTRNMVKHLCILGKWTNLSAMRILSLLHENNRDTYNRVKSLSFVFEQSENIFSFDRSIQEILFAHLLKTEPEFVFETRDAVNDFFKNAFYEVDAEENKSITNADRVLFFKFWSEIILRTTNGTKYLMKQYADNLEPISAYLDDDVVESVLLQFKNKIEKNAGTENISYSYFEHLLAQIKFSQGDRQYVQKLAESAYSKIADEESAEGTEYYLSAGHYSMALFYATSLNEDTDEYKNFSENFKFAVKYMTAAEKKSVVVYYGYLLKCLLNVYRKSDEAVAVIDKTMDFKKCFGDYSHELVANLLLYKLSALNHLGKVTEFNQVAQSCSKALKEIDGIDLDIIYMNLMTVHLQDVFDYAGSLKIGRQGIALLKDKNFKEYGDQYFQFCGSVVLTCYLTLNKSQKNLKRARELSDIAIAGFTRTFDKMRQYQLRAQIEAEVGNFEKACEMLNKGINISLENPTPEQFKNFFEYSWYWYHFAKFSERLLKTADGKYFDIAKRAVEISRDEFLNYKNKIGDSPAHPDYITFSKMATCFDICGDAELAIQLHEEALRGVDSEIGGDIAANANGAALRLVMMANFLRTAEKNNFTDKAAELKQELQKSLEEYLNQVTLDSMKAPFVDSQELLADVEKMCRAILL